MKCDLWQSPTTQVNFVESENKTNSRKKWNVCVGGASVTAVVCEHLFISVLSIVVHPPSLVCIERIDASIPTTLYQPRKLQSTSLGSEDTPTARQRMHESNERSPFTGLQHTRKRRSSFKFNGLMSVNGSSNVWFVHRGRSNVTVAV